MRPATRPSRDPRGSFSAFDLDIRQLLEKGLLIRAVIDDLDFARELLGISRRIDIRNPDRYRLESGRLHLVPVLLHPLCAISHDTFPSNQSVTCNINREGYWFKLRHFALSTSTQGNGFPSIHSRNSPAADETWLKAWATPAWFSAATVSPPPATEISFLALVRSAACRAATMVPRSNGVISKAPSGPFQTSVAASSIAA